MFAVWLLDPDTSSPTRRLDVYSWCFTPNLFERKTRFPGRKVRNRSTLICMEYLPTFTTWDPWIYATCREIFHTWTRHNFCHGGFWRPLFFGFCLQATAESIENIENDSGYRVGSKWVTPQKFNISPWKLGLLPQRGNDRLPFPSSFRGELYHRFSLDGKKDPLQSGHISQQLSGSTTTGWWFQIFLYIFYSHPYLWKIPILTNIFQRGWNHQLDKVFSMTTCSVGDQFILWFVVSPLRETKNKHTFDLTIDHPVWSLYQTARSLSKKNCSETNISGLLLGRYICRMWTFTKTLLMVPWHHKNTVFFGESGCGS